MGKCLNRISAYLGGMCVLVLVYEISQCQGAKYVNSFDLNEDELSTLLDELSLPQHRLVKDRPKAFKWVYLRPDASRIQNTFYEFEKPSSRRRRIVKRYPQTTYALQFYEFGRKSIPEKQVFTIQQEQN